MAGPFYIVLEGSEGCGKSTHAQRLAEALGAVATRETGGTPIGERLRAILHDTTVLDLDDRAETLIVAADRAQHMAEVVRPALAAGRHVVSDRSVYSTLAYQGYGRGLDLDEVRRVCDFAANGLWPDLVVLLDVPTEEAGARRVQEGGRRDRMEDEDDGFHDRVAKGFAELAQADPERWVVVDGVGSVDEVAGRVLRAYEDRLGG